MPLTLTRTFTDEQLAAIAHVVVDPVAWAEHAFAEVGANAVSAKVEKYATDYAAARSAMGTNYLNRAQRDAKEQAERDATRAAEPKP